MKIGIDARLLTGDNSGIGTYTNQLVKWLGVVDKKNSYILYSDKDHSISLPENFSQRVFHQKNRNLWTQFYLPAYLSEDGIDLYHGVANYDLPLRAKCKIISTIHDLIPLLYPKLSPFKHRLLFRFLIKKAIKKSARILTDSKASQKDIIDRYRSNKNKIDVIHLACHSKYKQIENENKIKAIKEKFQIRDKYLLFVGLIEPKKNLLVLIEAFGLFKETINRENIKLVIAGSKGWFYKNLFETIKEKGLINEIIFTGFVSEEDLLLLYNGAEMFLFPSIYEGFGLPPLEAMACGTPVICANVSSLPEIIGDAGILIDPMDLKGWAEAINRVLKDDSLKKDMIGKGLKRANLFSWKKTARETLNAYEKVFNT